MGPGKTYANGPCSGADGDAADTKTAPTAYGGNDPETEEAGNAVRNYAPSIDPGNDSGTTSIDVGSTGGKALGTEGILVLLLLEL